MQGGQKSLTQNVGRKACGNNFSPMGLLNVIFPAPSKLASGVDPVLTAQLSPCLLPATAGRIHPEAKDVVDMQWKPLSEVIRMFTQNTKPPPSSRDLRAAMAAAAKPAAMKSSREASSARNIRIPRPGAATLHFVAWHLLQPSRGSSVLGWLAKRAGEAAPGHKNMQVELQALLRALGKKAADPLPKGPAVNPPPPPTLPDRAGPPPSAGGGSQQRPPMLWSGSSPPIELLAKPQRTVLRLRASDGAASLTTTGAA